MSRSPSRHLTTTAGSDVGDAVDRSVLAPDGQTGLLDGQGSLAGAHASSADGGSRSRASSKRSRDGRSVVVGRGVWERRERLSSAAWERRCGGRYLGPGTAWLEQGEEVQPNGALRRTRRYRLGRTIRGCLQRRDVSSDRTAPTRARPPTDGCDRDFEPFSGPSGHRDTGRGKIRGVREDNGRKREVGTGCEAADGAFHASALGSWRPSAPEHQHRHPKSMAHTPAVRASTMLSLPRRSLWSDPAPCAWTPGTMTSGWSSSWRGRSLPSRGCG